MNGWKYIGSNFYLQQIYERDGIRATEIQNHYCDIEDVEDDDRDMVDEEIVWREDTPDDDIIF
jgi:hypothetical protein